MLPIYLAMLDGEDEKNKFESLYLTYRKLMFHVANGILNEGPRGGRSASGVFENS